MIGNIMYIIFGEYGSLKQEWENKNKNRNKRGRKGGTIQDRIS